MTKLESLLLSLSHNDIEEFYYYYVLRRMYATLGAKSYVENYGKLGELFIQCQALGAVFGLTCPPVAVSESEALATLLNHADNKYSSHNTAGLPLPLWGEPLVDQDGATTP